MRRAREAILARGGAARSNVFTRFLLALYGEVPWRGVPVMPVEIMLLPRWFPFHLAKVSYWARTVLVPLLVLQALKPRPKNRARRRHRRAVRRRRPTGCAPGRGGRTRSAPWAQIFGAIDAVLQGRRAALPERLAPARHRESTRPSSTSG